MEPFYLRFIYDGKTILFAYVEPGSANINLQKNRPKSLVDQENYFHILKLILMEQSCAIKDGPYDFDLFGFPMGELFLYQSELVPAEKMVAKCFLAALPLRPQNTLHSMKADGTDIIIVT